MERFSLSLCANGRYRLASPDGDVWFWHEDRWKASSRRGQGPARSRVDEMATFFAACDALWDQEYFERFGREPQPSGQFVPDEMCRPRGRPRGPSRATLKRRAQAVEWRLQGMSVDTIAARQGVDQSTIWRDLREAGVSKAALASR